MSTLREHVMADLASGKRETFATAPEYYSDLAARAGVTPLYASTKYNRIVRQMRKASGIPTTKKKEKIEKAEPAEIISRDRLLKKAQAEQKQYKAQYDRLLEMYEESEQRFDALVSVKEDVDIVHIDPSTQSHTHEATPVIMLSDWHFEEQVDEATINGINHYNLDIAARRWSRCIQNSLKLVNKERHTSAINQMVVWLGGDMITGYIHEELEESNYLSPTQATRFAKERIISALLFYKEHGNFQKIVVVCNYGNHGRTNKKPRFSTGYKNSYEWMMYMDIQDYFSQDDLFEFHIPCGLYAYIDIMGTVCRFWHGDNIRYQGGIGGLTIPLIKAIHRANEHQKADFNFMGHYHQFWEATKDCIVNGSGIGYNAYAQRIGAPPQEPMQGFKLIDKKYGPTVKMPIICK